MRLDLDLCCSLLAVEPIFTVLKMRRYVDYAYMRLLVLVATQRVGAESASTEHYSGESALIQYWVNLVRLIGNEGAVVISQSVHFLVSWP